MGGRASAYGGFDRFTQFSRHLTGLSAHVEVWEAITNALIEYLDADFVASATRSTSRDLEMRAVHFADSAAEIRWSEYIGAKSSRATTSSTPTSDVYDAIQSVFANNSSSPRFVSRTDSSGLVIMPIAYDDHVQDAIAAGFLKEERSLLDTVAKRLGRVAERLILRDSLEQTNRIVHNNPTVIFRWKADEGWPVEFVSENICILVTTLRISCTGEYHTSRLFIPKMPIV